MEAAASIVGLLAAGVKIYGALHQLIFSSIGAPLLARTLCDEVRDFRFALERLQPHVNGSSPITQPGSSRTDVEHLSWTLAGCVVTFSLLEKKLDRVLAQHGRMTTLARLRWVFAESDILQLVNRLQQHKATLTLLLTIFISESVSEAEEYRVKLDTQLEEVISQLSNANNSGPNAVADDNMSVITDSDSSSITAVTGRMKLYRHSFESALFTSRPYRRSAAAPAMSLSSSQGRGMRWSLFSGGSNDDVLSLPITTIEPHDPRQTLAETANIPGIPLPLRIASIYNSSWYTSTIAPSVNSDTIPSLGELGPDSPDATFLHACSVGNVAAALHALKLGANIEARDKLGITGLICAVHANHKTIVGALLDAGANIHIKDYQGKNALHNAAIEGRSEICEFLLGRGAHLESRETTHSTPLHLAITHGHQAVIKLLLDRGADLEAKNYDRKTPLSVALGGGHSVIIEQLLDRGANIEVMDGSGNTVLHLAVVSGSTEIIRQLLLHGANTETKNNSEHTALHEAVIRENDAVVTVLLAGGADSEVRDRAQHTPLHLAAFRGYDAIVKTLLDGGANIEAKNTYGDRPLHFAAINNRHSVVSLLLDRGADMESVDQVGNTALLGPGARGHKAVVEELLDRGANIEAKNKGGYSTLNLAAMQNRSDMVTLLLDRGANANKQDSSRNTAL